MSPLLETSALAVTYRGQSRPALADLSLQVQAGEIVGLVGESGSGKSTAALAVLGLLPSTADVTGEITLAGERLDRLSARARRARLGEAMAYVPQEPLNALNPTLRIARQLDLALRRRGPRDPEARRRVLVETLAKTGLADPERVLQSFPFQLSGGQLQRVLIALALMLDPVLLVADEPTTALDVTVQAEVLALIEAAARTGGKGVLFISHNIAVVRKLCDRVVVMRDGAVVESGPSQAVIGQRRRPTPAT
jgi:ABC-type glutathione transport system ATPase component